MASGSEKDITSVCGLAGTRVACPWQRREQESLLDKNGKEVAMARSCDPGAHGLLGAGEQEEHVRRRTVVGSRPGEEGEKVYPRLDPLSPKSPTGHGAHSHTATLWKQSPQSVLTGSMLEQRRRTLNRIRLD